MNDFVDRIVADLRAFSGELLEPGLRSGVADSGIRIPHGSNSLRIEAVRRFCGLVPALLADLETSHSPTRLVDHMAFTPAGASLSRRPTDYRYTQGALLPFRWQRAVPIPEPQGDALCWILHIAGEHRDALARLHGRMRKQVDEALIARRGGSVWAEQDHESLQRVLERVDEAGHRLDRVQSRVAQAAGGRLFASSHPPRPFPASPAWNVLRRHEAQWSIMHTSVAIATAPLLKDRVESADLPELYQRWCGVKLIEALTTHGWHPAGDAVGPLFLGGCIRFKKDERTIGVWVEARLTRKQTHPSGFYCATGEEATPDYLIVTPGPGGSDAFVIDATKTADPTVLMEKSRYLRLLAGSAAVRIAGVPVVRRPLRSWAAAPVQLDACRLDSPDGSRGVVPLHPLHWSPAPLFHWVGDIDRHVSAWGKPG